MRGDRDEVPIWVYKDGPAFERSCPNCGRFLKMPETGKWRERWDGICEFEKINCSKCKIERLEDAMGLLKRARIFVELAADVGDDDDIEASKLLLPEIDAALSHC